MWTLLEALSESGTLQRFIYFVNSEKESTADLQLPQQGQEVLAPPPLVVPVGAALRGPAFFCLPVDLSVEGQWSRIWLMNIA